MERRIARRCLPALGLALFCLSVGAGARADSVVVTSQNCLHLSDSPKGKIKRQTIYTQNAEADVCLLQEVMKSANIGDVTPGNYMFQVSDLKGHSSYKERYAVVYASTLQARTPVGMANYPDVQKKFSRPPAGTLLQTQNGTLTWFINYHAIFGKSVSVRRAEVGEMAKVYTYFENLVVSGLMTSRIVMAGDWNLGAKDSGFDELKALGNLMIEPNVETSLTRAGLPSEPYDHFVYKSTQIDASDFALIDLPLGNDGAWFRANVSDHRGIECLVEY